MCDTFTKVLIAFGATSLITLLAIVVAYLFGIIPKKKPAGLAVEDDEPDGLLNDLDEALLRHCSPFGRLTMNRSQETRNKQYESIQRFVLTLSDQQLVTGLAIFVIGYYRHCTMFSYHFFTIVALGWFSSTTHLSNLTVLRDYFNDSPSLKYTRLFGIVATYILLFTGLLVLYNEFSFDVRVQCRFDRIVIRDIRPLNCICMILVLCYLTIIHLSKSLGFYFKRQRPFSSIRGTLLYLVRRDKNRLSSRKHHYAHSLADISASQSSWMPRYLRAYVLTFNFVYSEFLDSFLWEVLWLLFNNLYGIRQIFWTRLYVGNRVRKTGDENDWGFGQLLALFLLALPVLAAAQAYQGM